MREEVSHVATDGLSEAALAAVADLACSKSLHMAVSKDEGGAKSVVLRVTPSAPEWVSFFRENGKYVVGVDCRVIREETGFPAALDALRRLPCLNA